MATISKLVAQITADASNFIRETEKVKGQLKNLKDSFESFEAIGKAFAATGLLAAAATLGKMLETVNDLNAEFAAGKITSADYWETLRNDVAKTIPFIGNLGFQIRRFSEAFVGLEDPAVIQARADAANAAIEKIAKERKAAADAAEKEEKEFAKRQDEIAKKLEEAAKRRSDILLGVFDPRNETQKAIDAAGGLGIDGLIVAAMERKQALEAEKAAIDATQTAYEKLADQAASRAAQIFNSTRTPIERLDAAIRELNELFSQGLIDAETRARALDQAFRDLADARIAERKEQPESGSGGLFGESALSLGAASLDSAVFSRGAFASESPITSKLSQIEYNTRPLRQRQAVIV